jgi:hypothetical protein
LRADRENLSLQRGVYALPMLQNEMILDLRDDPFLPLLALDKIEDAPLTLRQHVVYLQAGKASSKW